MRLNVVVLVLHLDFVFFITQRIGIATLTRNPFRPVPTFSETKLLELVLQQCKGNALPPPAVPCVDLTPIWNTTIERYCRGIRRHEYVDPRPDPPTGVSGAVEIVGFVAAAAAPSAGYISNYKGERQLISLTVQKNRSSFRAA